MDNSLKHSQIILLLVLRKDSSSCRIATASVLATVHTKSALRNSNWIQKIGSQYFDTFLCFDLAEKCQFWTISVPVGGWNTKRTDFNAAQERFPSNKRLSVHSCFSSVSATSFSSAFSPCPSTCYSFFSFSGYYLHSYFICSTVVWRKSTLKNNVSFSFGSTVASKLPVCLKFCPHFSVITEVYREPS